MTLQALRYLIKVLDEGTILSASEKLHISQPSLSQAIIKIEKDMGTGLFLRNGKRLIPTSTCKYIADQGREILAKYNDFEENISKYVEKSKSNKSIGMPSGLCRLLQPYLIAEVYKILPEIKISMIEERSNTIEQMILEGNLDMGILHSPLVNQKLATMSLFKTTNYLAISKCNAFCKTHPYESLDKIQTVSLSEIGDIPFILMHHHKEDVLISKIFAESSFIPNVIQTTSMWINVVDYISHGNCAGLVDEMVVNHDINDKQVAYYKLDVDCYRTTYAVFHPRHMISKEEYAFIDCAKEYPRIIKQEVLQKLGKRV